MFEIQEALTFKSMCESSRKVAIVVHAHPDGDAMGCSCGLRAYLGAFTSAECRIVIPDSYPDTLSFFVPEGSVIDASREQEDAFAWVTSCDLLVVMDMNRFDRASVLAPALEQCTSPRVLIDHHLDPDRGKFSLVFSETEISSASELTYWILKGICPEGLPKEVLKPLLVGMTTDTNNFANSVWPSTFTMASEIIAAGVDRDEILSYLYNEYRENRLRALGYILSRKMEISSDGVAYVILDAGELNSFDLQDGETEGFVNIPLSLGKVRMSLLLKEDDGYYRVSVRSKKGVSANAYAKTFFHGGGHENASGGRLYFPGDIPGREMARDYVEQTAARFMRSTAPLGKN